MRGRPDVRGRRGHQPDELRHRHAERRWSARWPRAGHRRAADRSAASATISTSAASSRSDAAADTASAGRLLLLADWQPTQQFVDRLRGRFFAGGLVVFGLALAGGVMFSRRVSRPLRDIAAAAADIAGGNLSLQLPSAEARKT